VLRAAKHQDDMYNGHRPTPDRQPDHQRSHPVRPDNKSRLYKRFASA